MYRIKFTRRGGGRRQERQGWVSDDAYVKNAYHRNKIDDACPERAVASSHTHFQEPPISSLAVLILIFIHENGFLSDRSHKKVLLARIAGMMKCYLMFFLSTPVLFL